MLWWGRLYPCANAIVLESAKTLASTVVASFTAGLLERLTVHQPVMAMHVPKQRNRVGAISGFRLPPTARPTKCEFQPAWVGTSERHRHFRIVPAAPPVSVPEDGLSLIPRLGPFLCTFIRGSRSGTDGPWLGLNPVRCLWSHGVAFQQGKQAAIASDRAARGILDELELLAEIETASSERKVRYPFFKGRREDL